MPSELLERTAALRDEAWEAVKASKPYAVFKALDDATTVAGGTSALAGPAPVPRVSKPRRRKAGPGNRSNGSIARVPHGDAAEEALREAGEPLQIKPLMEAAIAKGAQISGDNPVNNFRSTVSKDERFASVQRGNTFFWWFEGEPLPPSWNEAAELVFDDGSADSSFYSNQKGGGSHAAATTQLASTT